MRFYRPHSFFTLLLTGFFFVSVPLLVALYSSVQILDGLEKQSVTAVYRSVDRVTNSRKIADLLQDEERKARLYDVLGEPSQLEAVNITHQEIEYALKHVATYNDHEPLTELLNAIKSKENYIVTEINRIAGNPDQLKEEQELVFSQYKDISKLSLSMVKTSQQLMVDDVEGLKLKVNQNKKKLAWQTSGLISFTVLITIMFISLISRPIRQIDKGIERLGDGNFHTPIAVSGPRDLENLGNKLDWLRKRLAKLDREKLKLVAHISHDLKTPLASIKEGAGLLRDELVGPINDDQKEVVGILDKNCSRLQRLIENILNFNMAQAREIPHQKDRIQLDNLISEVITDHRNSILVRNIQLEEQLPQVTIHGNKKQLKTVFDNLISNAVKFSPDNGKIRIRLKSDGKLASLLVEDNGIGIDEEERSRIFSPFFRGKGAEKSVIKGSGLGLAISREYVQNHGGTICLLSGGKGARFIVTLPLKT
jgi:two-component system sensor histidine kinase GlrK